MKPKTIEERITAIEAQRADLAAQLKQATTKAEQAARTGGNILAAQTTVRDLEGAISALDQALDDAQAEQAAEQAAAHRAQVVEQLRDLQQQRAQAAERAREHAAALAQALEAHLPALRGAPGEQRRLQTAVIEQLRQIDSGLKLRPHRVMQQAAVDYDAAVLDDLAAAEKLDFSILLAPCADGMPEPHAAPLDGFALLPNGPMAGALRRLLRAGPGAGSGAVPQPAAPEQAPAAGAAPAETPVAAYFRRRGDSAA
jgi:hypothetical protein